MTVQLLRLFVSSPGDVLPERQRVDLVVERLNGQFEGRVKIETVRWETSYYSAHDTFQKQIPEAANCDIVIAIFRTRLGTQLPAGFPAQPSGEPYPSGTAYEVLSAMECRKAGKDTPDVYVFRYPKAPAVELDAPDREEIVSQWGRLRHFFDTYFLNQKGEFIAAFQDYGSTDDFAKKVEDCLSQWLAKRGFVAHGAVWDRVLQGSPFPGLSAFEAERGSVFFGRDLAIAQAVERLRAADAEDHAPFLLIIGSSGSGKSSLLRAGLLPHLVLPGTIPEIDLWRTALVTPGASPFLALAEGLLSDAALGSELRQGAFGERSLLAKLLAGDAELALAPIREAVNRAAEKRRIDAHFDTARPARLALGIDQAERLFTELDPPATLAFATLLAALVREGLAYVIFAMRSDSYHHFQSVETLVALREDGATLDLVPPSASELEEIVTRPIEGCQPPLCFEHKDGRSLASLLVTDTKGGDALPMLQMTLSRLHAAEVARGDGVMRFADYRGMDAAVTEAANEALAELDGDARAELPSLIAGLVDDVSIDPLTDEQVPIVSALEREAFEAGNPARVRLVEAFVSKRLLTADGDGVHERLRPVHIALLRIWPQAVGIIAEAGNLFRIRRTLEPIVAEWRRAPDDGKDRHLDISPALLSGGQHLVERFGSDLSPAMRDFVAASSVALEGRKVEEQAAQEARLRDAEALVAAHKRITRRTRFGLAAALVLAALSLWQWRLMRIESARAQQTIAVATAAANSLVFDLSDRLRNVFGVPTATVKDVLNRASQLQNELAGVGGSNPELLQGHADALIKTSETMLDLGETPAALISAMEARDIAQGLANEEPANAPFQATLAQAAETVGAARVKEGNLPEAMKSYRQSLEGRDRLAKADPDSAKLQDDLAHSYASIGDAQVKQGNLSDAMKSYQASFDIRDRLSKADPDNLGIQSLLSRSYQKMGDVLAAQGNLAEATKSYQASLAIRDRLTRSEPDNAQWQNDLSYSYSNIGDMAVRQGNLAAAMIAYQTGQAIIERIAKSDPGRATWQNNLSNADVKMGEVLSAESNLPEAMKFYQASLTIDDRLTKSDPDNVVWQRANAMSDERIGDILIAQGNLPDAMKSYQLSLAIRDKLVKSDPSNSAWQHDLSASYGKLASAYRKGNQTAEAGTALVAGRAIVAPLVAQHPESMEWKKDLAWFDGQIAEMGNK